MSHTYKDKILANSLRGGRLSCSPSGARSALQRDHQLGRRGRTRRQRFLRPPGATLSLLNSPIQTLTNAASAQLWPGATDLKINIWHDQHLRLRYDCAECGVGESPPDSSVSRTASDTGARPDSLRQRPSTGRTGCSPSLTTSGCPRSGRRSPRSRTGRFSAESDTSLNSFHMHLHSNRQTSTM